MLAPIRFVINHPLNRDRKFKAAVDFVRWQIGSRLTGAPSINPFTRRTQIIAAPGMTGATGNVYCGLHEFADMGFLLHFLRREDIFVDVGANIGSYSILSAAEVGAETVSIEPVPDTFRLLAANIALNQAGQRTRLLNVAVGDSSGTIQFTKNLDTANCVAAYGEKDCIEVPIETLDTLIDRPATLLKIDVEGYETAVIAGASKTLANPALEAIIIELNGSGLKFGHDDEGIHQSLLGYDFTPFKYDPFKKKLAPLSTYSSHNTIYLRDSVLAQMRVDQAEAFEVRGQRIG